MTFPSFLQSLPQVVRAHRRFGATWLNEAGRLRKLIALERERPAGDEPAVLALHVCAFRGLPLWRADFRNLMFGDVLFERCSFWRGDFRGSTVHPREAIHFSRCYLRDADFRGMTGKVLLSAVDARGADFRGAELSDLQLEQVDLRGARLEGLDLRCVSYMTGVRVDPSDLVGCYIGGNQSALVEALVHGQPAGVAELYDVASGLVRHRRRGTRHRNRAVPRVTGAGSRAYVDCPGGAAGTVAAPNERDANGPQNPR